MSTRALLVVCALAVLAAVVVTAEAQETACAAASVRCDLISKYCNKIGSTASALGANVTTLINAASSLISSAKSLIDQGKCNDSLRVLASAYALCHRAYVELIKASPNLWSDVVRGLGETIANRTSYVIAKSAESANKTIVLPRDKVRECINRCLSSVKPGRCIEKCLHEVAPHARKLMDEVFANKTKIRVERYVNRTVGAAISEVVHNITNIRGIDRAIANTNKTLRILQIVREHLIALNASTAAISALDRAISNVRERLERLMAVRELVHTVREVGEKVKAKEAKIREIERKLNETKSKKEIEELLRQLNETKRELQEAISRISNISNMSIEARELKRLVSAIEKDVERVRKDVERIEERAREVGAAKIEREERWAERGREHPRCPACGK